MDVLFIRILGWPTPPPKPQGYHESRTTAAASRFTYEGNENRPQIH